MFQNNKVTWRCEHNADNRCSYLRRKKIPKPMLWTTETTIFIRMLARAFIQRKWPYLWFIANNDRIMLWGHSADNYFLNLSWNIHTYLSTFYNNLSIVDWQQIYFEIKENPYNQFFIITSTDSFTFRNKDTYNAFRSE